MAEYYFNLPPIDKLTTYQQAALKPTVAIALAGGPGTGKSVVSLYRHIACNEQGRNCQLLTYTTTLALYLTACCVKQSTQAANKVATIYRWCLQSEIRDEIIVDEAQDVGAERYNILKSVCGNISYGADDAQSLYPNQGSTAIQLRLLFPNNQPFTLKKNFRNTKCILRLARNSFPNANISQDDIDSCISEGNKPVLFITDGNNAIQDQTIIKIIEGFVNEKSQNIALLCPWGSTVQYFYNMISQKYPECSYYYRRDGNDVGIKNISNLHITTFKSSKGLEFDTVIIPIFHKAFDIIPPQFQTDWKDFYVGVTRAKTNLYLISNTDIPQIRNFVEIENISNNNINSTRIISNDKPTNDLPF
ncbi:MAG: hypothetical protein A2033_05155 [Bacteroidetes bacterium GWA2_31_9]|nr:MAG: hypothetical protein A2033_05155 [Bacteroidetes bacterium GWA2_31_9]